MVVANFDDVLKKISLNNWILDDLGDLARLKLQNVTHSSNNTLKELSILYYGKSNLPKLDIFISSDNIEINHYLLSKLKKEGKISDFSSSEKKSILVSLDSLNEMLVGCIRFLSESSFSKIESLNFKSASSPHMIGVIILTNKINYSDFYSLSRSIVHELGHQELFLINFLDPLTKSGDSNLNVYSPYQKTSRPPIGRLHSLYALFRMINLNKFLKMDYEDDLVLFNDTIDSLDGCLTPNGEKLVNTLRLNV